jgi:hypothetical protein
MKRLAIALTIAALAVPAAARDSLGVFAAWGAFRDPETPRCYAIARPEREHAGDWEPFASIGSWPGRNINGQVHFRLRREMADGDTPILIIGSQRFELTGRGPDAWAADRRADAAIIAAIRGGIDMRIAARSARHGRFAEDYSLRGAATAIDAAALGCAHL